jgi:hypothetical protein
MKRVAFAAVLAAGFSMLLAGVMPVAADQAQLRSSVINQFEVMGFDPQPIRDATDQQVSQANLVLSMGDGTSAERTNRFWR